MLQGNDSVCVAKECGIFSRAWFSGAADNIVRECTCGDLFPWIHGVKWCKVRRGRRFCSSEVLQNPDKACKMARVVFEDVIVESDNVAEDSCKDSSLLCEGSDHGLEHTIASREFVGNQPLVLKFIRPKEGRFSKKYGADQQRLQISDPPFDKLPNPATFACWKIRFKTEVCTCSQFSTETLRWIKEVEMVESVDDLKSSCSVRGIRMPDF